MRTAATNTMLRVVSEIHIAPENPAGVPDENRLPINRGDEGLDPIGSVWFVWSIWSIWFLWVAGSFGFYRSSNQIN